MAHHFLEISGAEMLRTSGFRLVGEAVATAAERMAMVVAHGDAGTGKSFAVEQAMLGLDGIDTHWLKFPSRATQKRVVGQILHEVEGVPHKGDRYEMIDEALEILADKPRLLVVDEAQELSYEALELLRHLHDDRATKFALVLVGADGCWELIARYPPLESRVLRRVHLVTLTEAEILSLIPTFHPLYRETPAEIISFVNTNFAHGNLRKWARFTSDAAVICERRGVQALTSDLATSVFMVQRGPVDDPVGKRPERPGRQRRD